MGESSDCISKQVGSPQLLLSLVLLCTPARWELLFSKTHGHQMHQGNLAHFSPDEENKPASLRTYCGSQNPTSRCLGTSKPSTFLMPVLLRLHGNVPVLSGPRGGQDPWPPRDVWKVRVKGLLTGVNPTAQGSLLHTLRGSGA